MEHIRKTTFNIDGITIHSSLFIPVNYNDLPSLSLKQLDNLVKKYDQLQLIVLNENLLLREKILKLIDPQLRSIKCIHIKFFENLDVINCREFYQV
jgi:hypothetical protein